MAKIKKIAIIAAIVLALLGGLTIYIGFINNNTYVKIRMFLAEKDMEKEQYDKAEELYRKVIDRDGMQVDAYLGLTKIYFQAERYQNAIALLKKACDVTGQRATFIPDLAIAVNGRAEQLLTKGEPQDAIDLLENIGNDYIGFTQIRGTLGAAYLAKAEQIRDSGDLKHALNFLAGADSERVDFEVFRMFRVEGFLTLASNALSEGNEGDAKQYYGMVLLLDPENAQAKEMMQRLQGETTDVYSFSINGTGVITLKANVYGSFRMTLPINVDFTLQYNGQDPEKARLYYKFHAEASLLGQKEQILYECYSSAEQGLRYERSSDGPWLYTEENRDIVSTAEKTFAAYEQMAHEGSTDANPVTYNNQNCAVKRDHKSSRDYLDLLSNVDTSKLTEMVSGLQTSEVRYISMDTDHIVHVEADLSGSDFGPLLEKAMEYADGTASDISVEECRLSFDVSGINVTTVQEPQLQGMSFPAQQ